MATTTPPQTPDLQSALNAFVMMHRANALLTAQLAQRHQCSVSDMRALVFIAGGGDTTPGVIGKELGLSTGAITTLVDRLEAAGWAHRVPNPHDRRSSYLEALPGGRDVLAEITAVYQDAFTAATATDTSYDELTTAFASLGNALRATMTHTANTPAAA